MHVSVLLPLMRKSTMQLKINKKAHRCPAHDACLCTAPAYSLKHIAVDNSLLQTCAQVPCTCCVPLHCLLLRIRKSTMQLRICVLKTNMHTGALHMLHASALLAPAYLQKHNSVENLRSYYKHAHRWPQFASLSTAPALLQMCNAVENCSYYKHAHRCPKHALPPARSCVRHHSRWHQGPSRGTGLCFSGGRCMLQIPIDVKCASVWHDSHQHKRLPSGAGLCFSGGAMHTTKLPIVNLVQLYGMTATSIEDCLQALASVY